MNKYDINFNLKDYVIFNILLIYFEQDYKNFYRIIDFYNLKKIDFKGLLKKFDEYFADDEQMIIDLDDNEIFLLISLLDVLLLDDKFYEYIYKLLFFDMNIVKKDIHDL